MNHWRNYPRQWSLLKPPLRPDAEVIERVRSLIGPHPGRVLLLGVTPELADAFDTVLAVDKSAAMIASVWPGDSPGKQAILGDWLEITGSEHAFDAVVGDGSINALASLDEIARLFRIIATVLKPTARFACRMYERPVTPFRDEDLLRTTASRATMNFHAFKWQLAMHVAAGTTASVRVDLIRRRFNELFPDRSQLAQRTGWSGEEIDTIDLYDGSTTAYTFPSRAEVLHVLPAEVSRIEFQSCGRYDLAACCPILTFAKF